MRAPALYEEQLDSLNVHCPIPGCDRTCRRSQLQQHLLSSEHYDKRSMTWKEDLGDKVCPAANVGCTFAGTATLLKLHIRSCSRVELQDELLLFRAELKNAQEELEKMQIALACSRADQAGSSRGMIGAKTAKAKRKKVDLRADTLEAGSVFPTPNWAQPPVKSTVQDGLSFANVLGR